MDAEVPITIVRRELATFVEANSGALATRDMVAAFVEKHADAIKAATAPLLHIALTKLVDDVSRRRTKAESAGQHDLFRGHSLPRAIMVTVDEGGTSRLRRRVPLKTPWPLIDAYLARKPKTRRQTRDTGLDDAMTRARPYLTRPEMTLEDGLIAADAAEKKAAEHG